MIQTTEAEGDVCFVYLPGGGEAPREIGGKAAGLARLTALGENVPRWVAVRASSPEAPLPAALRAEVLRALDLCGLQDKPLAVRSSALAEDGSARSYAGQFSTVLGVPGRDEPALWEAIARVQASGASDTVRAYELSRGICEPCVVAVVLQEMVDPSASGVAFSIDPVSGDRDTAVVAAVYGLGEGLVSGTLDGDTYRVSRSGRIASEVIRKELAVRLSPDGGTRLEPAPDQWREAPVLSDAEALQIAECAWRLERVFGAPQDLEWALVGPLHGSRQIVLLQARPITTRGHPAGERRVWDNSNIIESYHGPTTPLTFSFARGIYEEVYIQLCRVFGVEEALLARHRDVFANMLGLVRGRIYYNLLNWYRALSLLPGYALNREFMERMMGVREKLQDPPSPPYAAGKIKDTFRLVRMTGRLLREYRRLPGEIVRFHQRVDEALAPFAGQDLSRYSLQELSGLYRRLEREFLSQWRAPLVNDFFTMIAFGMFGRLVERWLPGASPSLLNDLLSGDGAIISTEPARRVGVLAERVRTCPRLSGLFLEPDERQIWTRIQRDPEFDGFQAEVQSYLHTFGERCANELKLETITFAEDPTLLIRMLRTYAAAPAPLPAAGSLRLEAEQRLRSSTAGLRRAVLLTALGATRARVRDRENLRFKRTRVFGLVRRIFLAIGGQLAAAGRLEDARHIFYLTIDEIFGAIEGAGVTADLRRLVSLRRKEFEAYALETPPPDRLETFGPPNVPPPAFRTPAPDRGQLRGTGCSAGVVRGPVRLVRHPSDAGDLQGCILAAERTDPGWTLLFPLASGLLVQRGSLLSHSAIVAREVGLPCIVGVAGLMEALRDGESVEMDGATGFIRRLELIS